jgi:hypothetical protein
MEFPLVHPDFISASPTDLLVEKVLFSSSLLELKLGAFTSKSPKWLRAILLLVRKWWRKLFTWN